MASVNKVIIVGRLGQDPDVRVFQNGDKIANLSIATSERWIDKQSGQPQERTEWHRVVLHGKVVSVAEQYLHKGAQVYIEGSLYTRKWTDNNGIERYSTEVKSYTVQMLGNRHDHPQSQPPQGAYAQPQPIHPQSHPAYAPQPTASQRQAAPRQLEGMSHSLYQPMPQPTQNVVSSDDMPF